MINNIKLNCY